MSDFKAGQSDICGHTDDNAEHPPILYYPPPPPSQVKYGKGKTRKPNHHTPTHTEREKRRETKLTLEMCTPPSLPGIDRISTGHTSTKATSGRLSRLCDSRGIVWRFSVGAFQNGASDTAPPPCIQLFFVCCLLRGRARGVSVVPHAWSSPTVRQAVYRIPQREKG